MFTTLDKVLVTLAVTLFACIISVAVIATVMAAM